MSCKDCKYFSKSIQFDNTYECRYNPPVPILVPHITRVIAYFPAIHKDHWCSKFEPKGTIQ